MTRDAKLTRRSLLRSAAAAVPVLGLGGRGEAQLSPGPGLGSRMNVVMFVTDQERKTQHFPAGWEQRNLPGLTRLKRNGLSFENAFTNACMCSPARATWMSGFFPAQHGVKYTLEEDMPDDQYPQVELPLPASLGNIATVMSAAGYNVVYKGKWHLNKPAGQFWVPDDVGQYGFQRWNPQDAGANQDVSQAGGGFVNNDGRFMTDDGPWQAGREGALPFLNSQAALQQPFFLIISLVNPHDVLFYPNTYRQAGYDASWLQGDIHVPLTFNENLLTKPRVQRQFLALSQIGLGRLSNREMLRSYLNFYGNLIKSSDRYLVQVLDTLEARGLRDNTLVIKTSDHGEMGLTHGGQRQKNFNFYEEALRVPLVYSNPRLYPRPRTTTAMVSHVDFLPTIANLFSAPPPARSSWQGVDYSRLIVDPSARPVQDYVVFTYDDFQSGQPSPPYPGPPNHIVSIREARYKLAEYHDVNGNVPSEWEMYDLLDDPLETRNLASPFHRRTREQQAQFDRLRIKLRRVQATRLRPPS
jgi:arylsulfatase A-like enzyme